MLYIEIGIIVLIIILQFYIFFKTRSELERFKYFFPKDLQSLKVEAVNVPKKIIKDTNDFLHILSILNDGKKIAPIEGEEYEEIEVLVTSLNVTNKHQVFSEIMQSTNAYLSKNKGAAADFNILQDTCERYIERLDNSVGNLISVPLYIGLAGTFVGIIVGLLGIDFTSDNGAISPDSINALLNGIIAAMSASLIGLILTVINTAFTYKNAVYQNDTDKNLYYNFLQRELLPVLNTGMAGSISSFRGVLNNFILKFGENISEYHDTAALLNDLSLIHISEPTRPY